MGHITEEEIKRVKAHQSSVFNRVERKNPPEPERSIILKAVQDQMDEMICRFLGIPVAQLEER
jgi:hypothetical protein